jgi:hypothetical protein
MTKLSNTQGIILATAAQRGDGNVLPLPGSLRGGAAGKVVTALLSRGLIREQVTDSFIKADAALNTIWRNEEDGRAVLLLITGTGLEAVGVEAESAPVAPTESAPTQSATEGRDEAHSAPVAAVEPASADPMRASRGRRQPPAERKTRSGRGTGSRAASRR